MHRHFATLFDRAYLIKGLTLHESLILHCSEPFTLTMLAMDDDTFRILSEMNLPNVEVLPVSGFERAMHLERVKESRTRKEYLWSLASNLVEYLLPWTDADGITYLDADLFFMADPVRMFEEMGDRSIAIIPHRLIPSKKHLEVNGRFNVGWATIRNDETGRRCIARWASQVREWCFNRVEGHRACGDQKYLDEWPELYGDRCCIIENIGANLAPWNLANYEVSQKDERVYVDDTEALFFHAHEFRDEKQLTNYALRPMDMLIYGRYVEAWTRSKMRIAEVEAIMEQRRAEAELQGQRA